MYVHDVLKAFMDEHGVETVFSLMSDGTKKLAGKLHADERVDVVETRHEQNALAMADGYSRATGELGVCMIGRGPGVAQTGTALVTATREASNVLVVVPESPLSTTFDTKEFPQEQFLRTLTEEVVTIRDRANVVSTLQRVFRRLDRGGGPIVLQVPWDLFNDEAGLEEDWTVPTEAQVEPNTALDPRQDRIDRALELYEAAEIDTPPVVVVGRGAMSADAKGAIGAFADRIDAVLVTTLQARGSLSDEPYAAGFIGGLGAPVANDFVRESDVLFAFGASLNPYTIDHGRLIDEGTTVVHVDLRRETINRYQPVDLGIVADARLAARALDRRFAEANVGPAGDFRTAEVRRRIEETPVLDRDEFPEQEGRIDPRDLVRTIDELLPEDRLVVGDGGHSQTFVVDGITITDPAEFLWTVNFASIGLGLPMGIGAALRTTDRFPVIFCGDAGFSMSTQALNTAVRAAVPITVVVMNDGLLGSEYHQLDLVGENPEGAHVEPPEFADVADAYGATGHTVRSVDELYTLEDAFSNPAAGPTVIDCKINAAVRHRAYEEDHGY